MSTLWYSSQEMFKLTRNRDVDLNIIGTHLDLIKKDEAKALLAHGYLHAFFWTADLKYLEMEEVDRMEKMPQRLHKMVAIDFP